MPDIDVAHGLKGLVYSIIGLLAVRVLSDILKGVWLFVNRHKIPTRDELLKLTSGLEKASDAYLNQKLVTEKMATDMRRIYLFLKVIAGEKWPVYLQQVKDIEKDELSQ